MIKKLLTAAIIIIVALLGVGLYTAALPYRGSGTVIYIPRHATADAVADTLAANLGKTYGMSAYCQWRAQGGDAARSYGRYEVADGTRACSFARRLLHNRQTPLRLTLVNMRTRDDLARRTAQNMDFTPEEFLAAADSVSGLAPEQLTAAILPDTYEFYWTTPAADVARRLVDHRNRFWNDTRRSKARQLKLTPEEAHTLASIVYSESKQAGEWGDIARLYLNRLAIGMPLQADPTAVFATGDFDARRVGNRHISYDSPYNTYIYRGLPPGPIYMPEGRVIDSVLNAPPRKWLYMCARPDMSGYHDFAVTYDAHRINAARYHRILNGKGISR